MISTRLARAGALVCLSPSAEYCHNMAIYLTASLALVDEWETNLCFDSRPPSSVL